MRLAVGDLPVPDWCRREVALVWLCGTAARNNLTGSGLQLYLGISEPLHISHGMLVDLPGTIHLRYGSQDTT